MKKFQLLTVITALTAAVGALAQVPPILNYQGRLSAGGTNVFNGSGQFKFALVNGGTSLNRQATAVATVSGGFLTVITVTDPGQGYVEAPAVTITDATGSSAIATAQLMGGAVSSITVRNPGSKYSPSPTVTIAPPPPNYAYVTYWSNDGSSTGGDQPGRAVPLPVNQGLFSVNMGDTGLSNITAVIPPAVFTNSDVRLRIWFSDGVAPFQQFCPDLRLTSAGYAMMAANVPDGAITTPKLAAAAVTSAQLAVGAVGNAQIQDGAVTSAKIADNTIGITKLSFNPGVSSVPASMQAFTSNGTWVRPSGVSTVCVKLWGGGGGCPTTSYACNGGGGGGYCEGVVSVSGDVSVTVGSGGAPTSGAPAGDGGTSSFLSLSASGGQSGGDRNSDDGGGGTGSGGAVNVPGQSGGMWAAIGGAAAMGGGFGGGGGPILASFPGGGGGGGQAGAPGLVIVYY